MHGVVIGHTDLGEADRIVRFLTAEQGRVAALARGARRSKKRFAGMLEVGNRVRIRVHQGRGSLPRIDEVELVDGLRRPRTDLVRLAQLTYGCEVAGRLAGEHVPAPRLTRLLVVWIELLEGEEQVGAASRQAFEAKALRFAGLLPGLQRCARCDRPLSGASHWPHDGGPLHPGCGEGPLIGSAAVATLEKLLKTPLFHTHDVGAAQPGWFLSERIQYHLRGPLKSAALLREVEGE